MKVSNWKNINACGVGYGENTDKVKKQIKWILLKLMMLLDTPLSDKYDKGWMVKELDDFIRGQNYLLFFEWPE